MEKQDGETNGTKTIIMKLLIALIFTGISLFASAQLKGDLKSSKRPIVKEFSFEIEGHKPGVLVFDISVNELGTVVACRLDKLASTGFSTPTMVAATNHIKAKLQFEADSKYPQFHTGIVIITVVKP